MTLDQAPAAAPDPTPPAEGLKRRPRAWWHRHLTSEERQRVLTELAIRRQDDWGIRFSVMLTLSIVVAVMGLSADSAAVVIGAMLLAPLMQPVLAAAACLAMALFRKSLRSMGHVLAATVGGIALSWLLALFFVNGELPNEVTSRTAPDIRDLVVALAAGAAGAYATVRRDVSSSLPGVAVAVALIPPLATVGIALEAGEPTFARGAMLLYTTNLAAIVLAGLVVFIITGFVPPKRLASTFRRSLSVAAVVAVIVVAIAIPLYRVSTQAVEASNQRIEAGAIVSNWLGSVEATRPPTVTFDGNRVLVEIRSFALPPDPAPLIERLQARFGADAVVSIEWDRVERPTTTTLPAPATTFVTDEERLYTSVERIVDAWLVDGISSRRDGLSIVGGVVRIDASGVGDPPSLATLIDRLDAELERTLEVQLTWIERESVSAGQPAPTPDELLVQQAAPTVSAWATDNGLRLVSVTATGGVVEIEVVGAVAPDATALLASLAAVIGPDRQVAVYFSERIDISTTVPTTVPAPQDAQPAEVTSTSVSE